LQGFGIDLSKFETCYSLPRGIIAKYNDYAILPTMTKEKVKEAFGFYGSLLCDGPTENDLGENDRNVSRIICCSWASDRLFLEYGFEDDSFQGLLKHHNLDEDPEIIEWKNRLSWII
jgi:hypothetical protein